VLEVGSARWTWREEPVAGGPAVGFDLDGVLSDAAARQHFLRGPRPDWDAFLSASGEDPLIEEVAIVLALLSPSLVIVLLTARPARVRDLTLDWLTRHRLRWDLLVMRRDGDYRPAHQFKREALRGIAASGLELKLCFEDDQRNVEMFRAEGVPAVYIHSGYYD
jgi:hypothetical protein